MTEKKSLNVFQRIAAVMADLQPVPKDKAVQKKDGSLKYKVTTSDAVTNALKPLMVKHGLIAGTRVVQHEQDGNCTIADIEIDIIDVLSTERYTVPSFGYGIDEQDKGPGKAVSYAVRYGLSKLFMLQTGEDPEHDQTSYEPRQAKELSTEKGSHTKAQVDYIMGLLERTGIDYDPEWLTIVREKYGVEPKELSAAQASDEIGRLKALEASQ